VTPLIVGSRSDAHVAAVLAALRDCHSVEPVVVDAPELQRSGFSVDLDQFVFEGATLSFRDAGTGWLRRYAPTAWGAGLPIGSLEAVTQRSFLSLVGALSRVGWRRWLTPLDSMLAAEERLSQLYVARDLGLRVPDTLVSASANEVLDRFGERVVVKPLGQGYYWDGGEPRAVFTRSLDGTTLDGLDFGAAPFVAQDLIDAKRHLRVVTVRDHAWVCELDAAHLPLDWRQEPVAHTRWRTTQNASVAEAALLLASTMNVGYSSQDWIDDGDGEAFVDLNPGGQWLFLPVEVSGRVTKAVAAFLAEAPI
jgi:hypothetical protein